jgi:putative DNA primase/helicase
MNTHCIYSLSEFLGQVITEKCWTAWRTEERKNKTTGEVKTTKVPYQTVTSESRSNDPTTWISIEDAEAVAATDGFINGGMGGVGLWLGIEYGTEYRVGGVDLDSCLSPDLTRWAREIIERFNTYGEISPSRTGLKLYFLYRVADLDAIRLITGTDWSKNFTERTGSDHAPGFELHIGHRYFAMTGDLYEGCPEALRVIEVEDVAWLINEVGHRFTRPQTLGSPSRQAGNATSSQSSQKRDHSRSGAAASRLMSLLVDGFVETYEQARERLLNDSDPDIVAWMNEKGRAFPLRSAPGGLVAA